MLAKRMVHPAQSKCLDTCSNKLYLVMYSAEEHRLCEKYSFPLQTGAELVHVEGLSSYETFQNAITQCLTNWERIICNFIVETWGSVRGHPAVKTVRADVKEAKSQLHSTFDDLVEKFQTPTFTLQQP